MAIKKGFCKYCKTSDLKQRIFTVNSEAEVCYCPNCMHQMTPKEAIDAFDDFINEKIELAKNYLYKYSEFKKAYELFAEVLDYSPDNPKALLGRILSLFTLSTVRKSQITNANILLINEANMFHKADFQQTYFSFLKELDKLSELYIKRLFQRLTLKKYFFDAECVQLYIVRIHEVLLLKSTLINESQILYDKFIKEDYQDLINFINNESIELTNKIKKEYISAEGYKYKLISFDNNGVALLAKSETRIDNKIYRYRYSTLDVKPSSDKISINDKIFKDYTYLNKLIKIVFPVSFVCLCFSIVLALLSIFIKKNEIKIWGIFPSFSVLTFLCFILFLSMHFIISKKTKLN